VDHHDAYNDSSRLGVANGNRGDLIGDTGDTLAVSLCRVNSRFNPFKVRNLGATVRRQTLWQIAVVRQRAQAYIPKWSGAPPRTQAAVRVQERAPKSSPHTREPLDLSLDAR
jgi:hypothetical protein